MACTKADTFVPEGQPQQWSLDICQRGVFNVTTNEAGNTVPVSDSRIRATGLSARTPCRFHLGRIGENARGDSMAWYCGSPGGGRTFASPMVTATNHRGNTVFVGHHSAPTWTELTYFSQDRVCGAIEV